MTPNHVSPIIALLLGVGMLTGCDKKPADTTETAQ
jgi:hypothetical protein